jgi:drug/metabolite transporter (DMT)-like permease
MVAPIPFVRGAMPGASALPAPVLPAILLVLVSVALFSMSDTMAKVLRADGMPSIEIAWIRYGLFTLFGAMLVGRRRFADISARRPGWQFLRAMAIVGSAVLFIIGLGILPIADATAISFVSPLLITALSIPLLHEEVGPRRWAAVLVGLLGVLIVIRPGFGAFQPAALLPVGSAFCWAVAMVTTRRIGLDDRAETTLFWTATGGLILLTALVPFVFVMPSLHELGIALALGACASSGQYLIVLAYRRAPASVLAPFSYGQLLTSTILGIIVFAAVPDDLTLPIFSVPYRGRRARQRPWRPAVLPSANVLNSR